MEAVSPVKLRFETLNAALKAAGEATRLRILALLAEAELTVSDLTAILRQSQPRISRHLRLLAEAGLVDRFREGSWAFFRLGERDSAAELARALFARLDPCDPAVARDRERLAGGPRRTRRRRAELFPAPCRRVGPHPQASRRRRRGRASDQRGASATSQFARCSISVPALGACWNSSDRTSSAAFGLDLSRRHAGAWRARGSTAPVSSIAACGRATSTISLCPNDSFDVVIIHQVLHFLDDGARAIAKRRACCARAAACWLSISRRTISNSCATSTPIAGSVLRPRR